MLVVSSLPGFIQLLVGLLGALFDLVEEHQEGLGVRLKHGFGAVETVFSHGGVLRQSLDLLLFGLQHLLD